MIPRKKLELPKDIIEQVLLRLPAKTLFKFRRVNKLFNHLSTRPAFVSDHTCHCYCHNSPPSLLLIHRDTPSRVVQVHHQKIQIRELQPLFPVCHNSFFDEPCVLTDTCNGLLCFARRRRIFPQFMIVNPLTRQCWPAWINDSKCKVNIVGFYHHPNSGTYRLLLRLYGSLHKDRYGVLTVGSNELKMLENSLSYLPIDYSGMRVVVHGKLYRWGALEGRDHKFCYPLVVVVFDTESESFSCLPSPDVFRIVGCSLTKVLEIEGSLCICNMYSSITVEAPYLKIDLWVLRKNRTWIKKKLCAKILRGQEEDDLVVLAYPHKLILVRSDGNDIASPEKEFTVYISDDDAIEKLVTARYSFGDEVSVVKYRETLAQIGI